MKKFIFISILLFATIIFSMHKIENSPRKVSKSELTNQLVSIAISVLEGKDYSDFRNSISPYASVIIDNKHESMTAILGNSIKRAKFVEGKSVKVEYVRLWFPENQENAFMVLETKSQDGKVVNWHTIYFTLAGSTDWQILSWHKG